MRVLVLSNLYPPDVLGGYELACAQAVSALRGRGHDVRVLAARPRKPVESPPHVSRRLDLTDEWSPAAMGRHPVASRIKLARSRVVNAYNVHVLTETIDEFRPDVLYVHNLVGLGGLGLIATLQFLRVPWVWQLGDYVPKELCSDSDGLIPGLAEAFTREVRGTYSVVSRRVIDELNTDGLALRGRVALVPNWITGKRPAPRTRYYRPGEPLKVMASGRVDSQKGIDVLIDAASILTREGHGGFTVDVYGHVVEPGFLVMIRSLGLEGVVSLKGPRPHAEILDLYGEYDLLMFPTRKREPFGLVPLEAAARGCVPVIAADCGVGEWLVHGVHCLKAARGAGAFAGVIRGVMSGEILLEGLARRAAEAVWNDFHLDRVIVRIETLLREASSGGRTPSGRPHEAYRLARMAEHMTQALIEEGLLDPRAR